MQDRETESLWPQPWGECIMGRSEGKKLSEYPAIHTSYGEFKKLFPQGQLLKKPEKGEAGSPYDGYFADPDKLGMFGRVNDYEKLKGKDKVFGIRVGVQQVAVSEAYLVEHGFALIPSLPDPVIVTYDTTGKTAAAFAFEGRQRGMIMGLKPQGDRLVGPGRRAVWSARTGKLIEGNGDDLPVAPTMSAYWFAWLSFFPSTELIY